MSLKRWLRGGNRLPRVRRLVRGVWFKFRSVKWFVQRGRRGYSDADLWSLDIYLSGVLSSALPKLSERTHGYPAELEGPMLWNDILEEMADGFRMYYEEPLELFHLEEREASLKKSLELFSYWFTGLWD